MIEDAKTFHADASVSPALDQSLEAKKHAWSRPTLTTWEVPEETQTPLPSGSDAGIK